MSSLEPPSRKARAGGQQAAAGSRGLAADISELIRPAAASQGFDMKNKKPGSNKILCMMVWLVGKSLL